MTKKHFNMIAVLLVLVAILNGCESDTLAVKVDELKKENEALQLEIGKLQGVIQAYEESSRLQNRNYIAELTESNPELNHFRSIQNWTSIAIKSDQQETVVTDQKLLESTGGLFIVQEAADEITTDHLIDPFSLELTNEQGTFVMEVLSQNIVTLPEILPGKFFRVSSDVADFAKAILPKPDYLPHESMESRMLNSGMLFVKEGETQFYMISSSRARHVTIAFLTGTKKIIEKPADIPSDIIDEIDFYLYGNQIKVAVYFNYIKIVDGSKVIWYQVDEFTSGQMHGQISAG